jgi:hypothetical protein
MQNDNDNKTDETEYRDAVWEYGKSSSLLDPSKEDMHETRKAMIRFALDYNIRDIRTYSGYKGDLLIEITTTDLALLPILKEHAESLGMQTVVKEKFDLQIHEIYCIMPDEDLYGLKLP